MTEPNYGRRLRIAIAGGGLAGGILMNVLVRQPHLNVHIYESAPEFSERGASLGISGVSQKALAEMSPDLIDVLHDAGAGSGPRFGEKILDLVFEKQTLSVHRAAFLKGLLEPVPRENMHASKKIVEIKEAEDGGVLLCFKDDSKEHFDGLIGADGIHGYTRQHILGADHPALKPVFAGFWDCRFLVPIEKARKALGEKFFKEERIYNWVGNGGMFLHGIVNNGELVQCIAAVADEDWSPAEWKRDLDKNTLKKVFAHWTNSPIAEGMIEILSENPELRAFAQFHHENDAPTYAKGRVCMMGDAAHAMTPWQGSSAGQSIEDAMILDVLIKEVKEPHQLDHAFKVYDEVRRPRSQRVVASSKTTGLISCGRQPEVGFDPDKIRTALASRWDFIKCLDVKDHKRAALSAFSA